MTGLRDKAISNIHLRKEMQQTLLRYILLTFFMIFVWGITGKGYFWPAWVIASFLISLIAKIIKSRLWIDLNGLSEVEIKQEITRLDSRKKSDGI